MQLYFSSAESFEELAMQLPHEILLAFSNALSIGFWPDGQPLTDRQRVLCQEAIALSPVYESALPLMN